MTVSSEQIFDPDAESILEETFLLMDRPGAVVSTETLS